MVRRASLGPRPSFPPPARPPMGSPPPPPSQSSGAPPLRPQNDRDSGPIKEKNSTNVRVSCRFRPRNRVEGENNSSSCVEFGQDGTTVKLQDGKNADPSAFTFDRIFDDKSGQREVYEFCAKPLVEDTLNGYNCTIFAYGQTGSGKTHTMMGPDGGELVENPELGGIVPRIASDIFIAMANAESETEFIIKVSFVEIYMERIRDLLNPTASGQNLKIRQEKGRGISLEGAEEVYVSTPEELLQVAAKGSACRAIASTRMNQDSSRSHSVFMLTVAQRNERTAQSKTGKLFLVDLAGSEMIKKTGATNNVLEEAKMINRSLSALGNVIKALVENSKHIPYRDSKLTRMLQDSLGGNSKTSLVITCSGASYNAVETLSTLRFGTRAKRIKNKPKVNQEYSIAEYKSMLRNAKETIRALGVYARSLESKSGITSNQSPLQIHRRQDSIAYTLDESFNAKLQNAFGEGEAASAAGPIDPGLPDKQHESLLRRAEEALTVALENADKLQVQLEDKQCELDISNDALEGLRRKTTELESIVAQSTTERQNLAQNIVELELYKQQSGYNLQELQLTIDGLRKEKQSLEDELGEPRSSSRRGSASSISNAEHDVTKNDLQVITDKYIELRLELFETQEQLADLEDDDHANIRAQLAEERETNKALSAELRLEKAKAHIAAQAEETWNLKIKNREGQIQFLEEALRDYQETFKTNVEEYQGQLSSLNSELSKYKMALDTLEENQRRPVESGFSKDDNCEDKKIRIVPRVIKPVRGRMRTMSSTGSDDSTEALPTIRRRNSSAARFTSTSELDFASNVNSSERPSPANWLMSKLGKLTPKSSESDLTCDERQLSKSVSSGNLLEQ